jgi:hypothetical protein
LTLDKQHKHAEAEPLLLEANEIAQQSPQLSVKDKRDSIERLCRFYIDWAVAAPGTGKLDKASVWRTRLTEFDEASRQPKSTAE